MSRVHKRVHRQKTPDASQARGRDLAQDQQQQKAEAQAKAAQAQKGQEQQQDPNTQTKQRVAKHQSHRHAVEQTRKSKEQDISR